MKKKLLCVIVSLILIMQSAPFVFAANDDMNVEVQMSAKLSNSSSYLSNVLSLQGSSANVDLKAVLNMTPVFNEFISLYQSAETTFNNIAAGGGPSAASLKAQLDALEIDSTFTVSMYIPKNVLVPSTYTAGSNMFGFTYAANSFYEISRVYDTTGSNYNVLTITIGAGQDASNKLTIGELNTNQATYLDDVAFEALNVQLNGAGSYTFKGTVTGNTNISGTVNGNAVSKNINYTGVYNGSADNIISTVNLTYSPTPSSNGSGTIVVSKKYVTTFVVDGKSDVVAPIAGNQLNFNYLPVPDKKGYTFDGWYLDGEMKNKVDKNITLSSDITLYGHFINEILESENHFAYVVGYPDGTVQPENSITREEVATIFYRLLKEDKRAAIESDSNFFTDVASDRWSNKYISTLTNGGYIEGYEDATFKPEAYITRAEFVTMATRFANLTKLANNSFSDVSGHWAIDYILKACNEGWIMGYEDNTFLPEENISRAEAMAIINRMLVRQVNAEGLHKDAKTWSDSSINDWFYYVVEEATNSHTFERQSDGVNETWLEIVE